ncbi:hypothetical protein EDC04DRAFT_3149806 [Pisolithus marmoratus]|nr:hypothetical protein EDC04DRAFT_3149806 [Pisolithus marmoratus]
MANKSLHGQYHIITLENNNYLGLPIDLPTFLPRPVVVLPPSIVPPPPFTVEPVDGRDNTYVILTEKRNTRAQEHCIFAFENEPAEEWVILPRESPNVHSIERRSESLAWTAPPPEESDRRVHLVQPSDPQFLPSQLFRFEPVLSQ